MFEWYVHLFHLKWAILSDVSDNVQYVICEEEEKKKKKIYYTVM